MPSDEPTAASRRVIVVGSSGGIGAALKRQLESNGFEVTGLSRSSSRGTKGAMIDLAQEASVEAAALQLRSEAPFSMVLVSAGLLHDEKVRPEKSLRDLDPPTLMRLFSVNAVGPALVAKHFVPLLPKQGRCIFAALSARVGSIRDNRLGGWYGYRASKAALNIRHKWCRVCAIVVSDPTFEARHKNTLKQFESTTQQTYWTIVTSL